MNVEVYSILDTKAQAFNQPFFAPNNAVAFRVVESAMKNPQSGFTSFPADFTLFRVGTFDSIKGILIPASPAPENLGNLVQFLPPPAAVVPSPPLPTDLGKVA